MAHTPEVIKEILNRLTRQPDVIMPADTRHEEYPDTSGAGEDEGDAVRENISDYLKKIGFRHNPFDECVFMKRDMIVLLYVDDILVMSPSLEEIHWLEAELKAKYGDVESVYGEKFTYLGVLLSRQEDGSIHVSMPQYVEDIVRSVDGIKEYSSPADEYLFDKDPTAKALEPPKQKAFHSTVMKLMYMTKRVRGDVLLPDTK